MIINTKAKTITLGLIGSSLYVILSIGNATPAMSIECFGRAPDRVGSTGPDYMTGTSSVDTMNALEGNDAMFGEDSGDYLCSDSGQDVVFGENGPDHLRSGAGCDGISGDDGGDAIYGDGGNDHGAYCQFGLLSGAGSNDFIYGVDGDDSLNGGYGVDVLNGGPGLDGCYEGETNQYCEIIG